MFIAFEYFNFNQYRTLTYVKRFSILFIVLALYKFLIIIIIIFYRGHPRFRNFYSTIPVDIVRVKSKMNCLFDPARVVIKVRINKLYFVPEWLVFVVVIMLWNGGGLSMSRMSRSCSLILSCMGLSVSPTIFFHQYQALFTRHRLVSMLDCFICCFS